MPSSTQQFWQAAEDWSRRKHLVLSYYLTSAASKLRTQSQDGRVHVLDGFAGRGKYKDGSPGSPVHMGQLAEVCRQMSNPVALTIHNVEPNASSFQELENCTKKWVDAGYIVNQRGTFQQHLLPILDSIGSSPLFALLDPFRPSHLSFEDFQPLLERTNATELFIVFHTPAVVRVLNAVRPTAGTGEKSRRGMMAFLDRVFGGKHWETLLDAPTVTHDNVISCLNQQIESHVQRRSLSVYWHGIQARYNVDLKYHIIFITRHQHGVRLMNDAFCKEGQEVYKQVASAQTLTLDFEFEEAVIPAVERTPEQRILDLVASLIEIGREQPDKVWKREDLQFASMKQQFGKFTWTEHRRAITKLLNRSTAPKLFAPNIQPTKTGKIVTSEETLVRFGW